MKSIKKIVLALLAVVAVGANGYAFDWSALGSALNKNNVEGLINGVISTDKVEVADLAGTWKYDGPAVSFKSENLLEKAGGAAVATTIENKLAPYYKKAGLEGSKFTFDANGNVTVKLANGKSFSGKVSKGTTDGTLIFNFSKLQNNKLANLTVYVSKGTDLSLMFDVSKLQTLVSAIAKYSNKTSLTTASSLLSKYKGVYAGFKMKK